MSRTLVAMVVPVEGEPRLIDIPSRSSAELDAIYEAIGAETIEAVEILGVTVYLDEEGKYNGEDGGAKPNNTRVTRMALHDESIFPYDFIAGDVLFVGPPDDEGESTSLGIDKIREIQAALAGAPVA